MFGFFKKKINLVQASSLLISVAWERIEQDWNGDLRTLNEVLSTNFDEENTDLYVDIILALIALEFLAVKNLSSRYFNRVVNITTQLLSESEDIGDYSKMVMQQYLLPAITKADRVKRNPAEDITSMIMDKYCKSPNAFIGMGIMTVIVTKAGIWKTLNDNYKIVS